MSADARDFEAFRADLTSELVFGSLKGRRSRRDVSTYRNSAMIASLGASGESMLNFTQKYFLRMPPTLYPP
jgi:hypothetical protein